MLFRFGSVLFRNGGAADPSNGSNFASCNRDKKSRYRTHLYYSPDEDRHQGRKTRACQPLYKRCFILPKLHRVQRNTARCLFRDLKRFRGPKPYRNNLARVGQGNSPKSNFPKDACGAWYKENRVAITNKNPRQHGKIIQGRTTSAPGQV